MNTTRTLNTFSEAFFKILITVSLGVIVNSINGCFVYTYFKSEEFQRQPRYVLYINLVINDIIMLTMSAGLQLTNYITAYQVNKVFCCVMILILVITTKNSPLNLAGMAVERYIAVCHPLHHIQICTVKRTYALIALIWGASFIPACSDIVITLMTQPLTFFSGKAMCIPSDFYNTVHHKTSSTVVQIILLSFVCMTLIITYLKVMVAARAATASDQVSAKKARNTILLHGVQLLLYMLAYISPLLTVALIMVFPMSYSNIIFIAFLFTNFLPRLLSPLIYGVRDQRFSSQLKLHLSCRPCRDVKCYGC